MPTGEFAQQLEAWCHLVLNWVGYGTLVGLLAKAIMPGRDPGGAVATMLMGIGGSVIGCGTLMFFHNGAHVTPISPLGFLVATGGSFILLFFYRLLGGRFFAEGERRVVEVRTTPSARARRTVQRIED